MQRRGFLASILAAGYAPAAIGSGVLMPVRRIAPAFPIELREWLTQRKMESLVIITDELLADSQIVGRNPADVLQDLWGERADRAALARLRARCDERVTTRPAGMSYEEFHLGRPFSLESKTMT